MPPKKVSNKKAGSSAAAKNKSKGSKVRATRRTSQPNLSLTQNSSSTTAYLPNQHTLSTFTPQKQHKPDIPMVKVSSFVCKGCKNYVSRDKYKVIDHQKGQINPCSNAGVLHAFFYTTPGPRRGRKIETDLRASLAKKNVVNQSEP